MATPSDLLPTLRAVPFARELAAHGDRTALITIDGDLSYRDLAIRVQATADRLGGERRLVLLAGAHTVDALVTYLAALSAGHPVLLVPGDRSEAVRSLIDAYDPDVVAGPVDGQWVLDERRPTSAHDLHPDLALLLSTSGSTGAPKLVRLSHDNVRSNAEAIAAYLCLHEGDRAATTLPMHYCYGLSVINSHLSRGAGLILTDLSVADPAFWDLLRDHRGTSLAGVPYTFDLLDRVGFATMDLPHLRYVTQAGGRLAPERVARYAELGRRRGWDLFAMYGQTEATARMAYLPPELAEAHPHTIGVPVPGGTFHLRPLPDWPEPDTGELVYSGPNVMLGYADGPGDLALGRTVEELRTGDIARRTPQGFLEIVGRRSRFAKILGVRVDPQQVEALLERHGVAACCVSVDDELVVATAGPAEPDRVRRLVATLCGVPARAVRVRTLPELPRLATGKPDHRAVRELADNAPAEPAPAPAAPGTAGLCQLYAEILDYPDVTADHNFIELGGDSLTYVEMSIRLEKTLGHLPPHWHTLPIRDLRPAARPARRRRVLDTSVALRALCIVFVVGTHIKLFHITGGAHVLLAAAGFNFARFQLTTAGREERTRKGWGSALRVAVPSMAWIGLAFLLTPGYSPTNIALLNAVLGPHVGRVGHFWFIEALLAILIALLLLLRIPAVDRWERRYPFGLPMALMALGLITRYDLPELQARGHVPPALVFFWLFALGWAGARARGPLQRLLVTLVVVATVPGFYGPGQLQRELFVMAGVTLLIWVPTLPSLGSLNRVAGLLAGSSLYIYLTHWQVYPRVDDHSAVLALLASLAVGIGYAAVATRVMTLLARVRRPGWARWPGT